MSLLRHLFAPLWNKACDRHHEAGHPVLWFGDCPKAECRRWRWAK